MIQKPENELLQDALTRAVIGAFYDVHRVLGFGFREYVCALALERELRARGHRVDREVAVMVFYRGEPLALQTPDMIVDEKLVVELKATDSLHPGEESTLQPPVRDEFRGGTSAALRASAQVLSSHL